QHGIDRNETLCSDSRHTSDGRTRTVTQNRSRKASQKCEGRSILHIPENTPFRVLATSVCAACWWVALWLQSNPSTNCPPQKSICSGLPRAVPVPTLFSARQTGK